MKKNGNTLNKLYPRLVNPPIDWPCCDVFFQKTFLVMQSGFLTFSRHGQCFQTHHWDGVQTNNCSDEIRWSDSKTLLSGSLWDVNNIFIDWTTLRHLDKHVEYQAGSTLVQIFCLKPIVKFTQGHYKGYFMINAA